jgi:DNA-binding beta-propeller fold protein YncE
MRAFLEEVPMRVFTTRAWIRSAVVVGLGFAGVTALMTATASQRYEVWALDQSDSPGRTYGGGLYIWDGHDLERGQGTRPHGADHYDLGDHAAALCFEKTGAFPVRPHMVTISPTQTHAMIAFVASGHVLIVDARTREMVDCLRTTPGSNGARQAHMAWPSPDGTYITVANQNGKLLERIAANYETNSFHFEPAATLNLATCTTPSGAPCEAAGIRPDNAPVCPITESRSRLTFVTLRGGGLFVVDSRATPMRIVAEYDQTWIHGNGCGGAETGGKMYVDSGGGTAANLYQADLYVFPLRQFSRRPSPPNLPRPGVVFNESDQEHADAHGTAVARDGRYLWVADRGRNFFWVVDTRTDEVVNRIDLVSDLSEDPTPDLMHLSPNGSHAVVALRGPVPLSGDPHVSTGTTPGVGVLKVTRAGRSARLESIARVSNVDQNGTERADVHGIAVRLK